MFRFEAELWRYEGDAAWHFITLPREVSDDIAARPTGPRRGFGSVRVRVTIGGSTWSTSVFPDSKRGAYVLPVKKQVRAREALEAGDRVTVALELVDTSLKFTREAHGQAAAVATSRHSEDDQACIDALSLNDD